MMFERSPDDPLPLVYACSGCSNVAQLANDLALRLDRARLAEMSCIAGVGGDVPLLVRRARSGRPILALDGCPLHCVKGCLARHEVVPTLHLTPVSYTHLRAHETGRNLVCRLLLEKKK